MMRDHLSNEEFFSGLSKLIETLQKSGHGSVYLTQKRMTFDPSTAGPDTNLATKLAGDPLRDLHPPQPLPIIIRATDGKSKRRDKKSKNNDKIKLSTLVAPDALETFFTRYAEVCKAGMQSLKKRDRSKRKRDKGKKKKAAPAPADDKNS